MLSEGLRKIEALAATCQAMLCSIWSFASCLTQNQKQTWLLAFVSCFLFPFLHAVLSLTRSGFCWSQKKFKGGPDMMEVCVQVLLGRVPTDEPKKHLCTELRNGNIAEDFLGGTQFWSMFEDILSKKSRPPATHSPAFSATSWFSSSSAKPVFPIHISGPMPFS